MNKERYIIAVTLDITEQKQAREALRESEEKYRLLIENQTDMVVKFNTEGALLFVSPSYCKTFEKTQDELLGKKFLPLIHEDDRETAEKAIGKVYQPPYTGYVEERAMTKDGWRWQAWLNTAVLNEECEIDSIIATGRDINDRKQAEEALRESEEKYRELSDSLPQIVFETDEKGNLTFTNHIAFDILGYTREDFEKGLNALQILIPEDQDRALKNIQGVLKGEKLRGTEYTMLTKDGRRYPAMIYTSPIIRAGESVGMRGVIADLTEAKRTQKALLENEEKLARSRKMESLGLLAGGVAHDLNNILSGIVTYPELLLMDLPEDSSLRRPLKRP